jgi:hypothetical protein
MALHLRQHVLRSDLDDTWPDRVFERVNFSEVHVSGKDYGIKLRRISHDFLVFGVVCSDVRPMFSIVAMFTQIERPSDRKVDIDDDLQFAPAKSYSEVDATAPA